MPLIKLSAVLAQLQLSRSTLLRLINSSNFPKPIRLTQRIHVWNQDDIDAWLAKKNA
jgi:predicted DNA-binding transcriptional regulator AlpA